MQAQETAFFHGIAEEELAPLLARLEQRRFAAGDTVLAEGDSLREMYVVRSGTVDVFVADRLGHEHRINRVGAGAALGEVALFTGQPTSASVRALTDLEVVVIDESEFHRIAEIHPALYRNLGAMLAQRLAQASRRVVYNRAGRVAAFVSDGAPPELGYALAGSIAWHTRASTLLVVVGAGELPEALRQHTVDALGADASGGTGSRVQPRAFVLSAKPVGAFTSPSIGGTLEELGNRYDHVLVQVDVVDRQLVAAFRQLRLVNARASAPRSSRPGEVVSAWTGPQELTRPGRDGVLRVPALVDADRRALQGGRLPSSTAAGKALGWAARDLTGLKVGLALGGGSSKGYAHIGILQVLARAGIEADVVSGTSVGSAVAALHAVGFTPEAAAEVLDLVGNNAFRPTLPVTSLLSSRALGATMYRFIGDRRIEDAHIPLAVVAADLVTRNEVVFRRGPMQIALMASMAIPGIFPPQRIGRHVLVDGGVLNPVPSSAAVSLGADIVIAVKLAWQYETPVGKQPARSPYIAEVILRSFEIMQQRLGVDTAASAMIQIEPNFAGSVSVGLRNFSSGRRYVARGVSAAEAALPRITAVLPWLRPEP